MVNNAGGGKSRLNRQDFDFAVAHVRGRFRAASAGRRPLPHHQYLPRAMHRGEQKAGDEGEVIHEESEFRLVAGPV
jgi:hypothetical protein